MANGLARRICRFQAKIGFSCEGWVNQEAKQLFPEAIHGLAERYSFLIVPQTIEEMDFSKGVQYTSGHFGDIAIEEIKLYNNGISIDTRSSTDDSLLVLQDIFDFTANATGASVISRRKNFVSQIIFRSDIKLALLNPILQPIAERLADRTSQALSHPIVFEPTAISIGPDRSQIKLIPSVFSIERRTDAPFSENTYFSAAPLGTNEHLEFISEIENALCT